MRTELDPRSLRARKSRLASRIGQNGQNVLGMTAIVLIGVGLYCLLLDDLARIAYFSFAAATLFFMVLFWYRYGLREVAPKGTPQQLDDILEQNLLASLKQPLTPKAAWLAANRHAEAQFITNHLLLDHKLLAGILSDNEQDMILVWKQSLALIRPQSRGELHSGILATAILMTSPAATAVLTKYKLRTEELTEVLGWIDRHLGYWRQPKPYFGGIGRDWASGFTPTLEHFGQNISQGIEYSGGAAYYLAHSDLLDGIASSLGRSNGIALVGEYGTGKSTLVNGLAQYVLEGRYPGLQYYQIISLNASMILSYSGSQLEKLMLELFGEAVSAGNIILFLDEAELFFSSGVGAFDMSQILLPVLRNHNIKVIAAFTPTEWQRLQAQRSALASSFVSIAVQEPDEQSTYRILEDNAILLEHRYKTLVSYEALREAYRLSGQYMQEAAYPGKALNLLEQAMPYAQDRVLNAEAIQLAIERTKGVKVSVAQAPEADMLLHMEDRIHERMINQKRAVTVVASALRRGRAGVSSPKRPLGSFLFLGPTGVGKTELARSLAAVYFGDEHNMIRLDMSEYQQAGDVTRLLAAGDANDKSLLLSIREQPFSVVLLDEIEKAHSNILNLLLQMLDEGQLTDQQGRPASFRSSIIIATSNAGAVDIAARVKEGGTLDDFERPLIDKLISAGQFKPELVNRFDEVVLFRPLNEDELAQIANVMLGEVNRTLAAQQINVQLTPAALKEIVHAGYDPQFGARPMRRIIQKTVENAIAVKILRQEAGPGSTIILDATDLADKSD
ncbi:MAG TPA: AAA family ATPase [Candidatus Saccharimonadales bacterium]|nr:AAA family ATPase [Candidatus Saccharimonadales bacterium]